MSVVIDNKHSFSAEMVAKAVAFPNGHYLELEDPAFALNGLGRKIVQTQLVQIDGREASVSYLNNEKTNYSLVVGDENPSDLGSIDEILRANKDLFEALQKAFGGSMSSYSHLEMVLAINHAKQGEISSADEAKMRTVAAWARIQARRSQWVIQNRIEAMIKAPIDWKTVGI